MVSMLAAEVALIFISPVFTVTQFDPGHGSRNPPRRVLAGHPSTRFPFKSSLYLSLFGIPPCASGSSVCTYLFASCS